MGTLPAMEILPCGTAKKIRFTVAEGGPVTIFVADLFGRNLAPVYNRITGPGTHVALWTADKVVPGMYLVCAQIGGETSVRKVVVD